MLNARNISDLLSANIHPQLYPRMFLMTLHGKLVAYSTPSNVSKIRDQAAYISMVLRTRGTRKPSSTPGTSSTPASTEHTLKALTLESDALHVIARFIQPNLVLVLIGHTTARSRPSSANPDARAPSNPQDQTPNHQAASANQQLRRETASIRSSGSNSTSTARPSSFKMTLEHGADETYPPSSTAQPLDDLLRRAEKEAISSNGKDDDPAETEPETDREQWSDSNMSNGNGDEDNGKSKTTAAGAAAAGVHAAGPSQLSQQIAASTDAAAREAAAAADRGREAGVEGQEGQAGSRARQALAMSRELLALQRRKLEVVAEYVREELGGFRMPEDLQYGPR